MSHPLSTQPLHVHPDVVARRLGDRAVLVHLGTNNIFELNETGARIWELLAEHAEVQQIVTRLAAEFAVDEERASRELHDLVDRLAAAGLLQS